MFSGQEEVGRQRSQAGALGITLCSPSEFLNDILIKSSRCQVLFALPSELPALIKVTCLEVVYLQRGSRHCSRLEGMAQPERGPCLTHGLAGLLWAPCDRRLSNLLQQMLGC